MGICPQKEDGTLVEDSKTDCSNRLPLDARQIKLNDQLNMVCLEDFIFTKVVGRGSFGKVMLVQHKMTKRYYAMKILRKDVIQQKGQQVHTMNERQILEVAQHPFIVQLHFAFQTPEKLYLVTDFLAGGELFYHLRKSKKFPEERMKLYAAELILALDYLHQKGIIYRDLKPENILIGADGHLKLTDFGLSRTNLKEGERTYTFCGTPEYLAPEILLGQGHDQSADWWSLGALMYEMIAGAPPFYSNDKGMMFRNRLEKQIDMKPWFSQEASNLLAELLINEPTKRITIQQIKAHPFFNSLSWEDVYHKKVKPQFIPKLKDELDLQNIDPVFTEEEITDTPIDTLKADTFEKFTYANSQIFKQ
ncbi:unnamed protein product (macronuclear) [Paramecium tetraurelia]|uniref:Protein kinase domain-containing protein n=1 Tax=Paramecium tetraurelia TaxID=5888 RepID=A0DQ36_PARTE|nr:uncharacterized protein GSPATT00002553001 [Paramecium tetraurelia]CAK85153.1 unnamed protein product [Paramecium tetraurelia]|eukprot:XP_001452550.1 hypothetical protein (macronuclear) [Paramecium tetraurelia strain d4-2]